MDEGVEIHVLPCGMEGGHKTQDERREANIHECQQVKSRGRNGHLGSPGQEGLGVSGGWGVGFVNLFLLYCLSKAPR